MTATPEQFMHTLVSSLISDPSLNRFDSDTLALVAERMWAGLAVLSEKQRANPAASHTTVDLARWMTDDEALSDVPPAVLAILAPPMLTHLSKALLG